MKTKKQSNTNLEDFLREAFPLVREESERIWYKVKDVTVFEQQCYYQLESAFTTLGANIKNKKALIQRIIKRTAADNINKSRIKKVSSLDFLAENSGEEKQHFQLKDFLANVESEVLAKEKVANLAESDIRKEIVLNAWKDGCTNDTEIAGLLADKLGGTLAGNRSFVIRFREKCKLTLAV